MPVFVRTWLGQDRPLPIDRGLPDEVGILVEHNIEERPGTVLRFCMWGETASRHCHLTTLMALNLPFSRYPTLHGYGGRRLLLPHTEQP